MNKLTIMNSRQLIEQPAWNGATGQQPAAARRSPPGCADALQLIEQPHYIDAFFSASHRATFPARSTVRVIIRGRFFAVGECCMSASMTCAGVHPREDESAFSANDQSAWFAFPVLSSSVW